MCYNTIPCVMLSWYNIITCVTGLLSSCIITRVVLLCYKSTVIKRLINLPLAENRDYTLLLASKCKPEFIRNIKKNI